jgi:hypothetical protein
MKSATALVAAVCVMTAGCGSRNDVFERPPDGPPSESARTLDLPDPVSAAPAYVARLTHPVRPVQLAHVDHAPGVAVATAVSVQSVRVLGPSGPRKLEVGVVEPLEFRAIAPSATRDADFVWTSLLAGNAVITFDAAKALGVKGGGTISLGRDRLISVGAFADNGSPNVADVLIASNVGRRIGFDAPRMVMVGAKSGVVFDKLAEDLRERLPGARLKRLAPRGAPSAGAPSQATGTSAGALIGTMNFRILKNGFIDPDPAWVAANIADGVEPLLGTVRCHRLMFPQLRAALGEIEREGLAGLVRPRDYGGCFVPRFIDRNSSKPLSMHAFGLAIDLNVSTNQLGTAGDMDPRIVAVFEKWGFVWGGRWARPDPMHFELARLIQVP